jgi:hypothetical protein
VTERLDLDARVAEQHHRALHSEALLGALGPRTRPGERAEEVLLDLGIVSDRDFALELSVRAGLQMVGLRGFVPDEKLFLYVPVTLAQRERVVPLVLVGDSLKLATAYLDPDLSYVRGRFPHLELELVVAARSEILTALAPLTRG